MQRSRYLLPALVLLFLSSTAVSLAQVTVDFRQAANNDRPYRLGEVHWLNSILQRTNSVYYEGMSVPQRILLANIRSTAGNNHSLTFDHQAARGSLHAYDYITSYDQALSASASIAGPTTLVNLNECGAEMGPPNTLPATCASLHAGAYTRLVDVPDAMGSTGGRNIATSITGYESRFGNRTIKLYSSAPITAAALTFNGYTGGQNTYATYTLTWRSASNAVLIEMAGHLAMGFDVAGAGTGIGYGANLGAASINGAPFHFRLNQCDGHALGSQDNQIMGSTVQSSLSCNIVGPNPACVGTQNTYTYSTAATGLGYAWTLSNNTSGATISGSTTGQSVIVNAGTSQGGYTLNVAISNGAQTLTCSYPVTVNGISVTATPGTIVCYGSTCNVSVSATGGTAPYTGTGTFNRGSGTHTFTVTDANGCSGSSTVTINEPQQLATSTVAIASCNGGYGTVHVSAHGGIPPYNGTGSYSRPAGTYTFTVTDAVGCSSASTVTVPRQGQIMVTASAPPIPCNATTTTVTVTAAGGTAPYTGIGTFTRTAGTYSFTVTDANGCSATAPVTIAPASSISVSSSATPILCAGGSSTVTIAATGGTPPYSGTGTFTRTAGTYTFTVTDAASCSATTSVTVTEPPALSASASATPLSCTVTSSTVTVSATGGTPPYTGTGTFTRTAGTYNFTVTDANGCSATASVTVSGASSISVSSSATPILCAGGSSTVTIAATGGTPPYSGTGTFTKSAGTYTFTVTDAASCSATTSVTVTEPPAISASANATPILCSGGTSNITISATGGTPPYSGTGTFARSAGTYTFAVTDANSCTGNVSVTVTEPSPLVVGASATPVACNSSTSTVTVTATGGTSPYTGTGTFTRTPGTYTFTVTDANGCTGSATVIITAPPVLTVTASATPLSCTVTTSTVTVTATGGTPPYTGTGTFTRTAGTYTFTVTDAGSCSGSATVTVSGASQITVDASATPILCNGGNSTVTVTATGGTPPYLGTGTYTYPAGSYTFTVTDANGCANTKTITITEPPALSANAQTTPILCHGGGTATVDITATGGTPPYTGTGSFARTPGTYTFTVTDANGCSIGRMVVITEPPQLNIVASATPVLCKGGNSTVTVIASGGTPPYSGTGTFMRNPGTHTFTVTDANGCTQTVSLTITEPPLLTASANATPILCNGGTSNVTVNATGGTAPYTGTGTFSRLAGSYTFTVTDANGCTATTSVTITEPPRIVITANATPILCNGGGPSVVTITATGGTSPLTGGGSYDRMPGTYIFVVTDANGCRDSVTVTITEPPLLVVSANATPILCKGGSSTVTVGASGGTPPYTGTGMFTRTAGTYTFTVTDANGCAKTKTVTITEPPLLTAASTATPILCNGGQSTVTVTATGGTAPYTGTGTFTRTAGTYTFTVTDANGCTANTSVSVTEPPRIMINASATPILCNGGGPSVVTITATGGTSPLTGGGNYNRWPGTYIFVVTDANGCRDSVSVTITQPPPISLSANATPILCNGGTSTVTVSAQGGTAPYTGTGTFTRPAGQYVFTVTDANGCSKNITITILEPPALAATATAGTILCHGGTTTVTVSATGGTPSYQGTGTFTRGAGTYTFTVTDAKGCVTQTAVTINEPPAIGVGATWTPILCNGGQSTITITAAGGTPPYQGTGTFTAGAGTYTFMVTDSKGCSASKTIVITQPPVLDVTINASPILCNGGYSQITVAATGGTQPYTGVGVFTRPAGSYSFTVSDANGCTKTVSVTVNEPPRIVINASATPILCHGGGPSVVTITATGGTSPLTGGGNYDRWPGTYIFVVHDANGCRDSITVTITEPPLLTASSTATPILCNGGLSTVTVAGAGGTPPYTGTGTFARPAGSYTFTVMDANGCTAATTVTINQPPAIVVNASATPILCNGGTSTVTVTASGGTAPLTGTGTFTRTAGTYTFTVTDAHNCTNSVTVTINEPPVLHAASNATPILCHGDKSTVTVSATGGTPPYSGVGTFSYGPGTYTFTVTDAHLCTATTTVTITEPPALTATASAPPLNCASDSATVTVTANGGTPPYIGTGTFRRTPGTYTFTVTDANGCQKVVQATVTAPPLLLAAATSTPILCSGGHSTVTVTASGGVPPYTGTGTFTRTAGTWTFTVTDSLGCSTTAMATITEPAPLIALCSLNNTCVNGMKTVTVTVSGGTPPYSFTWNPALSSGPSLSVPCGFMGKITVLVHDANWNANDSNSSCAATCSVTILDNFNGGSDTTQITGVRITNSLPDLVESGADRSARADNNSEAEQTARSQKTATTQAADDYALFGNYPNPFNPTTTIRYHLPEASRVQLHIVNMIGQIVAVLVDQDVPSGTHFVTWNASSSDGLPVPSGSYLYRMQARSLSGSREFVKERLMMLTK